MALEVSSCPTRQSTDFETIPEKETGASASSTSEGEVQYVTRASLSIDFDKPWLVDAADVGRYLEAVRKALMEAIKAGKRIHI